ncbi:TMEM14 family protein [Calothrix sp. PCC 7507]|uniref:TMEM14 family protein n=1 Tax=Calothrix sp. PCC 7507 TaxID=99598 RepID=UPI00029F2116|nr:TMEM14 family protein [Calothrix sp. PCC 7507]AFY31438.1 protein of unknown function UPF0136 [Calothrix sp. PCC 7507]
MTLGIVAAVTYGIITIIGGMIGYIQASSKVSLFSGSISGLLLIVAAFAQFQGLTWGLSLAAFVTAILVVIFALRLVKTRKLMPAGLMTSLGVVALALMLNQLIAAR